MHCIGCLTVRSHQLIFGELQMKFSYTVMVAAACFIMIPSLCGLVLGIDRHDPIVGQFLLQITAVVGGLGIFFFAVSLVTFRFNRKSGEILLRPAGILLVFGLFGAIGQVRWWEVSFASLIPITLFMSWLAHAADRHITEIENDRPRRRPPPGPPPINLQPRLRHVGKGPLHELPDDYRPGDNVDKRV
ncbi:MAG: hypothetical protein JWL82_61 [Parcubacteria group bacterium]|nr:hypothetical protein [Parcubacteria group bacterium]